MRRAFLALLVLAAFAVSSCAVLRGLAVSPREEKAARAAAAKQRRVAEKQAAATQRLALFEALQPNGAELVAGEDRAYVAALKEEREIIADIEDAFDKDGRRPLLDRVQAKKAAYVLAAARLASAGGNVNMAFWTLIPLIDDSYTYAELSDEQLGMVRQTAKARAAVRQAEFVQHHTYADKKVGGNCTFSVAEMQADGSKSDIAYYFEGADLRIHVRCFAEDDLRNFSGAEGRLYVRLDVNSELGWGKPLGEPSSFAPGVRTLDATFTIPQGKLTQVDFAFVSASAGFEWVSSYDTSDGEQVPNWETTRVANSSFFWERSPKAL